MLQLPPTTDTAWDRIDNSRKARSTQSIYSYPIDLLLVLEHSKDTYGSRCVKVDGTSGDYFFVNVPSQLQELYGGSQSTVCAMVAVSNSLAE